KHGGSSGIISRRATRRKILFLPAARQAGAVFTSSAGRAERNVGGGFNTAQAVSPSMPPPARLGSCRKIKIDIQSPYWHLTGALRAAYRIRLMSAEVLFTRERSVAGRIERLIKNAGASFDAA